MAMLLAILYFPAQATSARGGRLLADRPSVHLLRGDRLCGIPLLRPVAQCCARCRAGLVLYRGRHLPVGCWTRSFSPQACSALSPHQLIAGAWAAHHLWAWAAQSPRLSRADRVRSFSWHRQRVPHRPHMEAGRGLVAASLCRVCTWTPMWFFASDNAFRDSAYFVLFVLYLATAVVFQLSLPHEEPWQARDCRRVRRLVAGLPSAFVGFQSSRLRCDRRPDLESAEVSGHHRHAAGAAGAAGCQQRVVCASRSVDRATQSARTSSTASPPRSSSRSRTIRVRRC